MNIMPPPHCMAHGNEAPKCDNTEAAKHPQDGPLDDQAKDEKQSDKN